DQIFARQVLKAGGTLVAVIPVSGYERFFRRSDQLIEYGQLLRHSEKVIQLDDSEPQRAFFQAGRRIAQECAMIIAVWDGKPSAGLGGTADVVAFARSIGRTVTILNPLARAVTCL